MQISLTAQKKASDDALAAKDKQIAYLTSQNAALTTENITLKSRSTSDKIGFGAGGFFAGLAAGIAVGNAAKK